MWYLCIEMLCLTITKALSRHEETLRWKGKPTSLAESLILLETADALTVQSFCTENPKVGSDESVWEALFLTQHPELHTPFLEVFDAYKTSDTSKLPLTAHMTKRTPMFWRDCWQSLKVLDPSVLSTVVRLVNRECHPIYPEEYLDDVSVICESHWTLAVVLGNMDSSGSCVVPIMLCCTPKLLESVFFYQDNLTDIILSVLMEKSLIGEEGVSILPPNHSLFMYSIKKGFVDLVPRFLLNTEKKDLLQLLLHAIRSGQDEVALTIAKDERIDVTFREIMRQSVTMGLIKTLSFLFKGLGGVLLGNKIEYICSVQNSAVGSHLEVFRFLMEYPEPDFWTPLDFVDIHAVIPSAFVDLRHKMLAILISSGFKPNSSSYFAISHWVKEGDIECVRLLLKDESPFMYPLSGSLIYSAAVTGNIEMLRLILEDGRENLVELLGTHLDPFKCSANKGRADIFSLLLSELGEDSIGHPSIAASAMKSCKIEIVRLLLPHLHQLDVESMNDGFGDLVIMGKADILQLLFSHNFVISDLALTKYLRLAYSDCLAVILGASGPLLDFHEALDTAIKYDKHKVLRLLLHDSRSVVRGGATRLVVGAADCGHTESLCALLGDERVKSALPLTNRTLIFIRHKSALVEELLEEYVDKAIDNLKEGKIEINDQLSRPQLKELARRMGHTVHAGMDREELFSLLSPDSEEDK